MLGYVPDFVLPKGKPVLLVLLSPLPKDYVSTSVPPSKDCVSTSVPPIHNDFVLISAPYPNFVWL